MSTDPLSALAAVPNACQALPGVITGGQPRAEQLAAFKAAGGALVLDIRDPAEPRPMDEPATARELGLEYVAVPVSAATLSDATLERIRDVLRTAEGRTAFFHCASGNRVGAALIPHLVLDQGIPEEDAVSTAVRVGLRSPELRDWALDYIRRQRNP
ncbi:MAG TPA: sulfur transferase domain-containing protein [Gemmatimonadales bacterium]|nr:sulfur transferase domain-containing protein [Gemmatimonadales bacterium]